MKKQPVENHDALLMNNSAYNRKAELIEQARNRWNESEWVLGMLRTKSPAPLPQPDNEMVVEWYKRILNPAQEGENENEFPG